MCPERRNRTEQHPAIAVALYNGNVYDYANPQLEQSQGAHQFGGRGDGRTVSQPVRPWSNVRNRLSVNTRYPTRLPHSNPMQDIGSQFNSTNSQYAPTASHPNYAPAAQQIPPFQRSEYTMPRTPQPYFDPATVSGGNALSGQSSTSTSTNNHAGSASTTTVTLPPDIAALPNARAPDTSPAIRSLRGGWSEPSATSYPQIRPQTVQAPWRVPTSVPQYSSHRRPSQPPA